MPENQREDSPILCLIPPSYLTTAYGPDPERTVSKLQGSARRLLNLPGLVPPLGSSGTPHPPNQVRLTLEKRQFPVE